MIVVSDPTPLNVLTRLRLLDHLPIGYPEIIVGLADATARLPGDFRLSPQLIDAALERERNRTSKSG